MLPFVCAAVSFLAAAPPAGARPEAQPQISRARVLAIALRVAKTESEGHPRQVRAAQGTLARALRVIFPAPTRTPWAPAGGPAAPGGPQSPVFLVAMNGRFVLNPSPPHGSRPRRGRVLEIVIDARAGFVEALSVRRELPVPLSRLGPVFALR
jgi:hypothetical protein